MFIFKLKSLEFVRNKELIGKANLTLISIITENHDDETMASIIQNKDNLEEVLEQQVSSGLNLRYFPNIKKIDDNAVVTFGETGLTLYESETVPKTLYWSMIALDTESDTRRLGEKMQSLLAGNTLADGIPGTVASIVAKTSIAATVAQVAGTMILKAIPSVLRVKGADKLGYIMNSYSKKLHYPENYRARTGQVDISGNMTYAYELLEDSSVQRFSENLPEQQPLSVDLSGSMAKTISQTMVKSAELVTSTGQVVRQ